ncbi:MAG: right-handed parallel beta-helix repeat-containing protein [Opitutales bacterium]
MPPADLILFPHNGVFQLKERLTGADLAEDTSPDPLLEQAMAALASDGGRLELGAGSYPIGNTIELPARTTLTGAGRSTRLQVSAAVGIRSMDTKAAIISDLAVEAAGADAETGIQFMGVGEGELTELHVQGFARNGILLSNNAFLCQVKGCRAANNAEANFRLEQLAQGSPVGNYIPNVVSHCQAYGGGIGFLLHRAIVVNLVGCQVLKTRGAAYVIRAVSNSVCLNGCRSFKIDGDAVRVEQSHEINITGNIFCWHRATGIVLEDVRWGVISGNNVIDSGSEMTEDARSIGIWLKGETRGVQVTGNAVFNWGGQGLLTYGIRETDTCSENQITENNINWFDRGGVVSDGARTRAKNNHAVKEPAFEGKPDMPDPRFRFDDLEAFLRE